MLSTIKRLPLVLALFGSALCLHATDADVGGAVSSAPAIFIAGDSTASDNSHHPNSPQRGWGQLFAELVIPPAELKNRARAGRSTKSYRDEKHWNKLLADLKKDDWVIIQFGHNDENAEKPAVYAPADGAYRDNLRRYIAEVRERGAYPLLATSVARRKWDEQGRFVDSVVDHVAAARVVAAEENVPLLDLHDLTVAMEQAAGVEGSLRFHLPQKKDDTHYSEYGARKVAALAAAEIHRMKLPFSTWVRLPSEGQALTSQPGVASAPTAESEAPASTNETATEKPEGAPPTLAEVAYGDNSRQTLNFWRAVSDRPTPVVIHMHGGGWTNGDKHKNANPEIESYLAAGISYVSFTYRLVPQARSAKVMPPVQWPMMDAARVVQFVRAHAAEWNIDKQRVGLTGGSAGACSSLWVAFHDDLADSASADPISRESTRVWCVAVADAQTSLDPLQMKEWTPNSVYGYHAFGFNAGGKYEARVAAFAQFVEKRDSVLKWILEYSPFAQATSDDPPVYLIYKNRPGLGQPQKDATHTANFGVKLKEKFDQMGRPCELVYPGAPDVKHPTLADYLIDKLRATAP